MSSWRSDKFKSLFKCVQTFEFIRSAKGHQLNILKHDLLAFWWHNNEQLEFQETLSPLKGARLIKGVD